jgi:hypothetical protein
VVMVLVVLLAQNFIYNDPATDQLIRAAMRANYDLRFDESRRLTSKLQHMYPDHPVGYLLDAESYWWEAQVNPGDQTIQRAYYAAQRVAVEKGKEALKENKYARIEVLSYLASAYGSLARFQLTEKSSYSSALHAGIKAIHYAHQVYAIDPNYYDVYVGLGAYNYFTATLPAAIKPFGFLIGVRGNKERGIEQLHIAMERSRHSRTEAKIVYYAVLLQENRYPDALRLLEGFMTEYPDNFVFYDWASSWFKVQHKYADGVQYFDSLARNQFNRSPLMAKHALLKKAYLEHMAGQDAAARQTLERIKSIPGTDQGFETQITALENTVR